MLKKSIFSIFFIFTSIAGAQIILPSIISDNMVLQADCKAPIWGKAEPNSKVTISCSWSKQSITTDTNDQGKWETTVVTPKKAKPSTIIITCGKETRTITNVLIGEVWLCSGQSNMEWPVSKTTNAVKEIKNAKYPKLRLFTVKETASDKPQEDCFGQWVECDPERAAEFGAVSYYFGRDLYKKLGRPVGVINSSVGGTSAHAWTSKKTLENNAVLKKYIAIDANNAANKPAIEKEYNEKLAAWKKEVMQAVAKTKPAPKKPRPPYTLRDDWKSGSLYNAMINPLMPFAIKGAVWYQGESNADDAITYRTLFPAMITDWRQNWKEGNFPFYFVQISAYGKTDLNLPPTDSNWAMLREAQTMTLALPNTGMAVSMDIGEANNIHPKNKQVVGDRLARLALAKNYGKKIAYSGPLYKGMKIEGNKIRIFFDYAEKGLETPRKMPLKGFAIAGSDKKFVWAKAKIDKNTVLVWSDQIQNPVAVRYGWADWIDCNLYNKQKMQASPFRTDNY